MNARQKAKYYKKLYEQTLAKTPVQFQVQRLKTDVIKTCTMVPYVMVKNQELSNYEEIFKEMVGLGLSDVIKNKMEIEVVDYPGMHCYKVYGCIRVVTSV